MKIFCVRHSVMHNHMKLLLNTDIGLFDSERLNTHRFVKHLSTDREETYLFSKVAIRFQYAGCYKNLLSFNMYI